MCSQIAYMANRAYVYQPYLHHQKKWSRVIQVAPGKWESRTIPLNAIMQGPLAGTESIGPGHTNEGQIASWDAPRSVSYEFFDKVCPLWARTWVNVREVRKKYGLAEELSRNGKAILEAFAEHLSKIDDPCVVVEHDHLFTFRCVDCRGRQTRILTSIFDAVILVLQSSPHSRSCRSRLCSPG